MILGGDRLMIGVKDLVDKYLGDEATKKREEKIVPMNVFYPSSAGQCIRKQWHEKKNPPVFPANVYKIFLVGNLTHDWLQSKIFTTGQSEVPMKWTDGEVSFSGRVDCIYDDRILEFKTIKDLGYVQSKPKPEHVAQINMYMHATGIHQGTIVYVTKNEIDILEHDVEYDESLYNDTVKGFKKLYKYLVQNKEPKPAKCISPWSCEYCRADRAKVAHIIKAVKAKKERMKAQKKLDEETQ